MSDYKYFLADARGATHGALTRMQEAGEALRQALNIIDTFQKKIIPVQITYDGQMKGLFFFKHSPLAKQLDSGKHNEI